MNSILTRASAALTYVRDRLNERSTIMFVFASMPTAVAMPHPWNIIGVGMLLSAALVKDGTVR